MPKVVGVPILGISRLLIGSFKTKCHLGAGPIGKCRIYYKGEGGGFPQVWVVVGLVSPSLHMVHLNTKNVLAMH